MHRSCVLTMRWMRVTKRDTRVGIVQAKAAKARELLASSLGVECESSYKEAPLYTRVEDAPFFEDNIKRHQVVKKYIVRRRVHMLCSDLVLLSC